MVVNYQNGKVYKLWCDQSDMLYIGSTTQSLAKRLGEHKRDIKSQRNKTYEKMQSYTNIRIELIEAFPCNSREELVAREGHYIRLHRKQLLNERIAGRTNKEYYEDNRDKIKEQQAAYEASNSDKIKERHALYYQNNRDKILERQVLYQGENRDKILEYATSYYKNNRDKHREQMAVWYQSNRDKILEQQNMYRAKNRDKISAYYQSNRDKIKKQNAARYQAKKKQNLTLNETTKFLEQQDIQTN